MSAAGIASSGPGVAYATAVTYTAAIPDTTVAAAAIVSTTAIVSTATPVPTAAPVAAIPRASADKEATYEPARSVIAVRRASVGIIRIVAVGTDRSRIPIAIISVSSTVPNPDAYAYLGVSRSRHQCYGDHQRTEQQEIS